MTTQKDCVTLEDPQNQKVRPIMSQTIDIRVSWKRAQLTLLHAPTSSYPDHLSYLKWPRALMQQLLSWNPITQLNKKMSILCCEWNLHWKTLWSMFCWTVQLKLVAGPVIHSGETDMDMEK